MSILTVSLGTALLWTGAVAPPPAAAARPVQDVQARVQELLESYRRTTSEFYARVRKVQDEAEVERLLSQENPLPAYIERFRELAYEGAGSEAGVTAWIQVGELSAQFGRAVEAREALEVLVGEHVDSPQLESVVQSLLYSAPLLGEDAARAALRSIRQGSPLRSVQASAQFSLAALLMGSQQEAEKREGRELFVDLGKSFQDVGNWAQRAKGMLFELDHLQVGMLAPDFETVDQDGVAWKLSDYRGKVVIVDFWGFW